MTGPAPRPLRRVLVANRGEIARRIMRTAREMGISTVAVYSDVDADEPFVREADTAVRLGGASPAESYLRADAIIEAAVRTGADAIHPGYGFLAENADFARACDEQGLIFVGPSAEAIDAMGSKIRAKQLLSAAGVPTLPDADATGLEGEALVAAAEHVGYPLLVKPSAGGGGKGMRVVSSAAGLIAAVDASRREAIGAFGDDALLLERYVESGRHVEIQIFGDSFGAVTHLNERECSVQRRHQKILEESPSVAVDAELRQEMGAAAIAAGSALQYTGAGTVEFLLGDEGEFFFLEVNTRLQVEHPVTEEVTGLDLVRLQLEVAGGMPLPSEVMEPAQRGHAIEVRLYAEDPQADFLPQSGTVTRLWFQPHPGIRVDAGVEDGSEVSVHYDPMVAKVIAHAPSRQEAAAVLSRALRTAQIDGLRTNRDFLVRLLDDEEFLAGDFDTRFLERERAGELIAPLLSDEEVGLMACAAALARQAERRAQATVLPTLPSGWRNHHAHDQMVELLAAEREVQVTYRFTRGEISDLSVDSHPVSDVVLVEAEASRVVLEIDRVRHEFHIRLAEPQIYVNGDAGQCDFAEVERFPDPAAQVAPGSLVAPMPGAVVRVDHQPGDSVEAGQPLLVLEAMKMEHEIVAPITGVLTAMPVAVGDQVQAGALLAAIDLTE